MKQLTRWFTLFSIALTTWFNPGFADGDAFFSNSAVMSTGDIVAVWIATDLTTGNHFIQARKNTFGVGWDTTITDLSSPSSDDAFDLPQLVIDDSDNITVAWTSYNYTTGKYEIISRMLPSGSSWGSIAIVTSEDSLQEFQLRTSFSGQLSLTWTSQSITFTEIHAASATFGGSWSTPPDVISQ